MRKTVVLGIYYGKENIRCESLLFGMNTRKKSHREAIRKYKKRNVMDINANFDRFIW